MWYLCCLFTGEKIGVEYLFDQTGRPLSLSKVDDLEVPAQGPISSPEEDMDTENGLEPYTEPEGFDVVHSLQEDMAASKAISLQGVEVFRWKSYFNCQHQYAQSE